MLSQKISGVSNTPGIWKFILPREIILENLVIDGLPPKQVHISMNDMIIMEARSREAIWTFNMKVPIGPYVIPEIIITTLDLAADRGDPQITICFSKGMAVVGLDLSLDPQFSMILQDGKDIPHYRKIYTNCEILYTVVGPYKTLSPIPEETKVYQQELAIVNGFPHLLYWNCGVINSPYHCAHGEKLI